MTIKKIMLVCLMLIFAGNTGLAAEKEKKSSSENMLKNCAVDMVNSRNNRVDDVIRFTAMEEFKIDEVRIIPKGAEICGRITKIKKAGGWGQPGKIKINFDKIEVGFGKILPLSMVLEKRGQNPNFFVQFSLFGGLVKGKQAIIRPNDVFCLAVKK